MKEAPRYSLRIIIVIFAVAEICATTGLGGETNALSRARASTAGFPKLLFFRNCEAFMESNNVAAFERCVGNRTIGLIGKPFAEEVERRTPAVLARFSEYSAGRPDDLVLVHYNSLSADPRSLPPTYSACHWLHYAGTRIVRECSATDTEIAVADVNLFRAAEGGSKKHPEATGYGDDVTICPLTADGKPDWNTFEYAHIVAIDKMKGVLTVKRGIAGTKPRDWTAHAAYIAALDVSDPGKLGDFGYWWYNYSATCPRDKNGKRLIEVMSEDLGRRLTDRSVAGQLDGIEFDMLGFKPVLRKDQVKRLGRGLDYDGDGVADFADAGGTNQYGRGVYEFLAALRQKVGPEKAIMMDMGRRGIGGILNGIESEGWPSPFDLEFASWSVGINEHRWWIERVVKPCLSYIHLKYGDRTTGIRSTLTPARRRLVYAGAMMLNGIVTVNWPPQPAEYADLVVPDELLKGKEKIPNWLGQPLEPSRMLALATPDVWQGKGTTLDQDFIRQIHGIDAAVSAAVDGGRPCLRTRAVNRGQQTFRFQLPGIAQAKDGWVLRFLVRAEVPLAGLPGNVARRIKLKPAKESSPEFSVRIGEFIPETWADDKWFEATCFFPVYDGSPIAVEVEGPGAMLFAGFTAHRSADAMTRLFENGLVLVNPSRVPYEFDLAKLYPGKNFRRLSGADINTGAAVNGPVTLGERDGLFLILDR